MEKAKHFFIHHKKLVFITSLILIDILLFAVIYGLKYNSHRKLDLLSNTSFELLDNYMNVSIYGKETDDILLTVEHLTKETANRMVHELHTIFDSKQNIQHTISPETFDLLTQYTEFYHLEDTIKLSQETLSCTLLAPLEINIPFLVKGYLADYISNYIHNTYHYEYNIVKIANIVSSKGDLPNHYKRIIKLSNPLIEDESLNLVGLIEIPRKSLVTVYPSNLVPKENEPFYTIEDLDFPQNVICMTVVAPNALNSILILEHLLTLEQNDWMSYIESLDDIDLIVLNTGYSLQISNGIREDQFQQRYNYTIQKEKATPITE